MSRILFISQTYAPSHDAVSQLLTDLTEGLVTMGYEVHVLTNATNYMTGQALARHEMMAGVRIWRTPGVPAKRHHPLERVVSYIGFLALSGPALALIPLPDVVVYLSTPPLLTWSSLPLKWQGKTKTVFWAQDVYPEVPIQMGYLRNPWLRALLHAVEHQCTASVDRIVTIGDLMKDTFERKGVSPKVLTVIPNWSIVREQPAIRRESNPLLCKLGLVNKFVIQYSGNMGVVHDMTPFIEAMRLTQDNSSIHWLFIGDGKRKNELETAISSYHLNKVTFLPYQPMSELWTSMNAADVSLVSLRPEMEGLVVPSKLYGAMAAGIPIIFVGDSNGEVARVISKHNCGIAVNSGGALAEAVTTLQHDMRLRIQMGNNARAAYESNFSRKNAIHRFARLFAELSR